MACGSSENPTTNSYMNDVVPPRIFQSLKDENF